MICSNIPLRTDIWIISKLSGTKIKMQRKLLSTDLCVLVRAFPRDRRYGGAAEWKHAVTDTAQAALPGWRPPPTPPCPRRFPALHPAGSFSCPLPRSARSPSLPLRHQVPGLPSTCQALGEGADPHPMGQAPVPWTGPSHLRPRGGRAPDAWRVRAAGGHGAAGGRTGERVQAS